MVSINYRVVSRWQPIALMSDMTIKRPVERSRVDHLVDRFLRLNMQQGIPFAQQTQCVGTIAAYLSPEEYKAVAEKMLETLAGSSSSGVQQTVLAIRNSAQDVVRSALKKIMAGQADLSAEKAQLERLKHLEVHVIEGFHDIVRTCYSTKTLSRILDFLFEYCPHLRVLDLSTLYVLTPGIIRQLTKFPLLTTLALVATNMNDRLVGALAGMPLKRLFLDRTNVQGETLAFLSRDIEELGLSHCYSIKTLRGLCVMRGQSSMRLKRLDLSSTRVRDAVLWHLDNGIEELYLAGCGITDAGIQGLGCVLDERGQVIQEATRLKVCNFSSNPITGSTLKGLYRNIQEISLESCKDLTDEGLEGLGRVFNAQEELLWDAVKLKKCNLNWTNIKGKSLWTLDVNLEDLSLESCPNITDESIGQLGRIRTVHGTVLREAIRLKRCNLSCTHITGASLFLLDRNIEHISLKWCERLTDEGVEGLGFLLNNRREVIRPAMRLQSCDLSGTNIQGNGLWKLFRGIQKFFFRGCLSLTDEGIAGLGAAISGHTVRQAMRLKELDLSFTYVTGSTFKQLYRGIQVLFLESCERLTDAGVHGLGEAVDDEGQVLQTPMLLQELDMSKTGIKGETLFALNRGMKKIRLRWCKNLTDDGVRGLGMRAARNGRTIREAMTLEECDLSGTPIAGSTLWTLDRGIKIMTLTACQKLQDEGVQGLGRIVNARGEVTQEAMQLEQLKMGGTHIEGKALQTLYDGIIRLELTYCERLTDEATRGLSEILDAEGRVVRQGMNLSYLSLEHTNIQGQHLWGINPGIEALDLRSCTMLAIEAVEKMARFRIIPNQAGSTAYCQLPGHIPSRLSRQFQEYQDKSIIAPGQMPGGGMHIYPDADEEKV